MAYSDIIIAPKPVGDIQWVKCSYNSIKGEIKSERKIEANTFKLNIEVPEDVSAKIIVPENYRKSSCELIDLSKNKTVDVKIDDGVFKVTSGKYKVIAK